MLITRSDSRAPPAAWDSVVVTGRARAAIRRATREAAKAQYGGLGRQIVERAFERAGAEFSEDKLKAALPRLARASLDDVFIGVGRGEMFSADVVRAIHPDFKEEREAGPGVPPERERLVRPAQGGQPGVPSAGQVRRGASMPMRGIDLDTPVRFAPKGGAVPGERIVGIRGREGITIYPIHSPALTDSTTGPSCGSTCAGISRTRRKAVYPTQIVVTRSTSRARSASSRRRSAKTAAISTPLRLRPTARTSANYVIDLQVRDIQHLNAILSQNCAARMSSTRSNG